MGGRRSGIANLAWCDVHSERSAPLLLPLLIRMSWTLERIWASLDLEQTRTLEQSLQERFLKLFDSKRLLGLSAIRLPMLQDFASPVWLELIRPLVWPITPHTFRFRRVTSECFPIRLRPPALVPICPRDHSDIFTMLMLSMYYSHTHEAQYRIKSSVFHFVFVQVNAQLISLLGLRLTRCRLKRRTRNVDGGGMPGGVP